jgi:hypothetical protein
LTVEELIILWTPAEIASFGLPADQIAKAVLVGGAAADPYLAEICPEIIAVADANAAVAAAFASAGD